MTNFDGKNNLNSRDAFNSRFIYEGFALSKGRERPTMSRVGIEDFNKYSNMFYGKYVFESGAILKPKTKYLVERDGYYMFDFVAAALDDMLDNYRNGIIRRKIKIDDRYLSKPKVQAGYIDFDSFYAGLRNKFKTIISTYISGKNLAPSIGSFDDFVAVFFEYAQEASSRMPLTKSGYMMAKDVSILSTGLAIQIGDRDASIDQPKVDEFFNSPNFEYFRNSAINYGFLIDKNVPWRIVADLGSPQLIKYIVNSKIPYDDNFFGPNSILDAYDRIALDELQVIKDFVINLYSDFVTRNPYYRKTTLGGYNCESTTSLIRRPPVNVPRLQTDYPLSYWMPIYVRMKFGESNLNADEATINFVSNNALQIMEQKDTVSAINYIQRKTFNTTALEGSLAYEARKFDTKDLTEASVGDILEEIQQETLFEKFELF
tara:strand:- start:44 stop:1336 length:1293 start_codon:yes stop_codon:yes gene_type:complete